MEEHVSLKTAWKLSTGFEKPLKVVNIPKGWYSKHLFSLLWFISKLPFSVLWLNILLLAVLKAGRVSLSQHLRWTDRHRERRTPRATSLMLTSSGSQPLCGLLSWDPATQHSEPWSESAAAAQPPPILLLRTLEGLSIPGVGPAPAPAVPLIYTTARANFTTPHLLLG